MYCVNQCTLTSLYLLRCYESTYPGDGAKKVPQNVVLKVFSDVIARNASVVSFDHDWIIFWLIALIA